MKGNGFEPFFYNLNISSSFGYLKVHKVLYKHDIHIESKSYKFKLLGKLVL